MPETGKIIENEKVIEKILKRLELWDLKVKPSPKVKALSVTIPIDDPDSIRKRVSTDKGKMRWQALASRMRGHKTYFEEGVL